MIKTFTYNGKTSNSFGVYIKGEGTYNSPERDVEYVTIPGRDGLLLLDKGRFSNVAVSYPCFIKRDFESNAAEVRQWLIGDTNYHRLEDDFHPDEFRLAVYEGAVDFNVFANIVGDFVLNFSAKPQRWLKSGETAQEVQSGQLLENPTEMTAKPLILVNGAGELTVGDISVITTAPNTVIDCETMNCYYNGENLNNVTQVGEFPILGPGSTEITIGEGISSVQITPRWWRL